MAEDGDQTSLRLEYADLTFGRQLAGNLRKILNGADLLVATVLTASTYWLAPGLGSHLETGAAISITVLAAALAAMALGAAITDTKLLSRARARRSLSNLFFFYWWVSGVSGTAALFCWLLAAYRDTTAPPRPLPVWAAYIAVFLVSYALLGTVSLAAVTFRVLAIYRELLGDGSEGQSDPGPRR